MAFMAIYILMHKYELPHLESAYSKKVCSELAPLRGGHTSKRKAKKVTLPKWNKLRTYLSPTFEKA